MTPTRTSGSRGGNLEIRRRFKGLGKPLRKSLGTPDKKQFRQRVALLEKLVKLEQYELLRAFQDDDITIEQLIEADANQRLAQGMDGVRLTANLWDAIEATLPKMGKAPATRARYARSFRALQRKGKRYLPDSATIASLAGVDWKELLSEWDATGTDWMHLRRAISRFLSRHLDLYHPFRRKVMREVPTAVEHKRRPNVSIAAFREIVAQAPEHLRNCYWTLAITGMRLNEYRALGRADLDRFSRTINVPGTKNVNSAAPIMVDAELWTYVSAAVPCPVGEEYLRDKWNDAVEDAGYEDIHLHDLRHCHAQWAVDAGVAESKVQSSLRHKTPGQTRDYVMRNESGEVSAALARVLVIHKPKPARRA